MYFYIADTAHDASLAHQLSVLPVVSLSLFVSMFSIGKDKKHKFKILHYHWRFSTGFGPIPWLMMSELFSPEVII